MRFGKKLLAVTAAALLINAVPLTTYGEVIVYNSKTSGSTTKTVTATESKTTSGPASVSIDTELESETAFTGPTVKKVSLKETYHETYKTYEESISDLFFLYANVANGGLTHERVSVDIPANVAYTMEKDGLPYPYISKQYVSEKGTYVLKLTAVENPDLPLSEQTEYQSVFRFRIQDAPPAEETASSSGSTTGSISASSSLWGTNAGSSIPAGEVLDITSIAAAEAEKAGAPTENAGAEAAEVWNPLTAEDMKPVETEEAQDTQTEEAAELEEISAGPVTRPQVFDPDTGRYKVTLENRIELISSVPEGFVGPNSVELRLAEEDAVLAVLKRGEEEVSFTNGSSIVEKGNYCLEVNGSSYFFRIAGHVNDMDAYEAPTGMKFTSVYLNNEKLTLSSETKVPMETDGTYTFLMNGEDGDALEVSLVKDTVAPEIEVTSGRNKVEIQYLSDDIAAIVLTKDGTVVDGFAGYSITKPGSYVLTVSDVAGNETSVDFVLKYQVNLYGIFAVVLVAFVIAGIVVFVIHTKKNMKFR